MDSYAPRKLMGVWFVPAERQGALPRGEKYPLFQERLSMCKTLLRQEI